MEPHEDVDVEEEVARIFDNANNENVIAARNRPPAPRPFLGREEDVEKSFGGPEIFPPEALSRRPDTPRPNLYLSPPRHRKERKPLTHTHRPIPVAGPSAAELISAFRKCNLAPKKGVTKPHKK